MRDKLGRFVKGHTLSFKSEKKRIASIKSLGKWIGRIPPMTGRKHKKESKIKMSFSALDKHIGENNGMYIKDRSKLAKRQKRNDPCYFEWVKSVKKRDKYICQLADETCSNDKVAHHIKSWRNYPELRYDINNGITLCQVHHPRARAKEIEMEEIFISLLKSKNV